MRNSIYEFQPSDAVRFSQSVGIKTKKVGDQLKFQRCPYCHGGKHHDNETFAISLKDGTFNCKRSSCGIKGNMFTLAKDFNFELSEEYTRYLNRGHGAGYRRFSKYEKKESTSPAIEYLKSRGISKAVAEKYGITTKKDDDKVLVFPFTDGCGSLRFIKYRKTDFDKEKDHSGKEWCEANCMPILFGMEQCNLENKTLIITEGQIDSLSVATAGIENAVSVPTGSKGFTWVPFCWDWMGNFEKIIVFGDRENDQITLLDEISKRFRRWQVFHVREEDYKGCKDANEILVVYGTKGKEYVKHCIDNAVQIPINQIIDLAEVEDVNPFDIEKLETGLKKADSLLYGGIPFGGVTLISGKTGDGKSTFANQLILNAAKGGYKSFIYSGELPNYLIKSWLTLQAAGPDFCIGNHSELYGKTVYHVSDKIKAKINAWFREKIYLYDNSSIEVDERTELLELVEKAIQQYGVRVVLIDNLMTAIGMSGERWYDKYEAQGQFVNKLAKLAIEYNVLILLVAHKRKNAFGNNENDEIMGSSNIGNLIMLNLVYEKDRRKEKAEINDDQRYLKVTKNRLFGMVEEKGFVLNYDEASKRIYEGKDISKDISNDFGWETDENDGFHSIEDTNYEIPY